MESSNAFLIEEYKICKQQIADAIKAMDQIEIFVIGAIAAVYVYLFTQAADNLVAPVMAVPAILAMAGALRTAALDDTIRVLNNYVQSIEARKPEIGFTGFYRGNRNGKMKRSREIVWVSLILGTLSIGGITVWFGPFWKQPTKVESSSAKISAGDHPKVRGNVE